MSAKLNGVSGFHICVPGHMCIHTYIPGIRKTRVHGHMCIHKQGPVKGEIMNSGGVMGGVGGTVHI